MVEEKKMKPMATRKTKSLSQFKTELFWGSAVLILSSGIGAMLALSI